MMLAVDRPDKSGPMGRRFRDSAIDDEPDALDHAKAEAVQAPVMFSQPGIQTSASSRRRCALVDSFSLHANTSVDAADRGALERLARYLLRPMLSAHRLTVRSDGRVEYRFRRPDPTGRTSAFGDSGFHTPSVRTAAAALFATRTLIESLDPEPPPHRRDVTS